MTQEDRDQIVAQLRALAKDNQKLLESKRSDNPITNISTSTKMIVYHELASMFETLRTE